MGRRAVSIPPCVLCLWLASACAEDAGPRVPGAPGADNGSASTGRAQGRPSDAGMDGDGAVAPFEPASPGDFTPRFSVFECFAVDATGDAPQPVQLPADFAPTFHFSGWLRGCDAPTLVVGLGEGTCTRGAACADGGFGSDEVCLPAQSHRLTFEIGAAALDDARLRPGSNLISVETREDGLRIDYLRPAPLVPAGSWGNCNGSDGALVLTNIGTEAGAPLEVGFNQNLTVCGGSAADPQPLSGLTFSTLGVGLDALCP